MSNHKTALHNETILIVWSNGVYTLIPCNDYKANAIKSHIINSLKEWKQDRDEQLEYLKTDKDYGVCGIVWHLDSLLNYTFGLQQLMLREIDDILPTRFIQIGEPYDLGENETEQEMRKLYTNYKYPYKIEVSENENNN